MFSQFINFTFIFIFLLAILSSTSAGWYPSWGGKTSSTTTVTEEFAFNSEPKFESVKDSEDVTDRETHPKTELTSPATTPSFNASSSPEETRNLTDLAFGKPFDAYETSSPELSNTTPNETTTPTTPEQTATITSTLTTSTTTSTTTSAPGTERSRLDENDLDLNETSVTETNESGGNTYSFRDIGDAPDDRSSISNTNSNSKLNYDDPITTTTTLQGNESVPANITILDNSNKTTTTGRPVSDDVSSNETIARNASPRSVEDPKEDNEYTTVLPVNETVTTENVTSSVTTISPSTGSPKDLIESVGRRVNRNSANSIGSNQLLPILFTLLISLIF